MHSLVTKVTLETCASQLMITAYAQVKEMTSIHDAAASLLPAIPICHLLPLPFPLPAFPLSPFPLRAPPPCFLCLLLPPDFFMLLPLAFSAPLALPPPAQQGQGRLCCGFVAQARTGSHIDLLQALKHGLQLMRYGNGA